MKQKELTKTFMMISNDKTPNFFDLYKWKYFSAVCMVGLMLVHRLPRLSNIKPPSYPRCSTANSGGSGLKWIIRQTKQEGTWDVQTILNSVYH